MFHEQAKILSCQWIPILATLTSAGVCCTNSSDILPKPTCSTWLFLLFQAYKTQKYNIEQGDQEQMVSFNWRRILVFFSKNNFNKLCFCFLNSFLEYTMIHQMPFKWWKTKWNIMIFWSITPSWLQMIQLGRNALGRDFMGYSDKSRSWCIASRGAPRLKETNLTHLIGSYINPPKPTDF